MSTQPWVQATAGTGVELERFQQVHFSEPDGKTSTTSGSALRQRGKAANGKTNASVSSMEMK